MPLLTELENLFFVRFYKDVTPTAFQAATEIRFNFFRFDVFKSNNKQL